MEEYFCIVKCFEKNGNSSYDLVGVPVLDAYRIRDGKLTQKEALAARVKKTTVDFQIVASPIYKYQLIKVYCDDGKSELFTITSSIDRNTATQLLVDKKYEKFIYLVAKYCDKSNENNIYRYKLELKKLIEKQPDLCKEFVLYFADKIANYYPKYCKKYIKEIVDNANNLGDIKINDEPGDIKTLDESIKYIGFLLKLTQAKSKQIPTPSGFGKGTKGRLSFIISPTEVDFIDQSITGLYVKVTKGKDL